MGQSDWSMLYIGPPRVPLLPGTPEGERGRSHEVPEGTMHTTPNCTWCSAKFLRARIRKGLNVAMYFANSALMAANTHTHNITHRQSSKFTYSPHLLPHSFSLSSLPSPPLPSSPPLLPSPSPSYPSPLLSFPFLSCPPQLTLHKHSHCQHDVLLHSSAMSQTGLEHHQQRCHHRVCDTESVCGAHFPQEAL